MQNLSRDVKQQLGAVLLKLKKEDFHLSPEEMQLAEVLEGWGLAKYVGPNRLPNINSMEENWAYNQLATNAHFELTGRGQAIVLNHTERRLLAGKFLLPGEFPWYDCWPWKLLWPIIAAIITCLIVDAVKDWQN